MNPIVPMLAAALVLELAGAVLAGAALVLAIAIGRRAWVRTARTRARPGQMRAHAEQVEGTFSATDARGLTGFHEYHVALAPDGTPVATNIVQYQDRGIAVTWFDLAHTVRGRRVRRSAVLLDVPSHFGMSLVWIVGRLAPEAAGDAPEGLPWLDGSSDPEFAARYAVATNNPIFARALVAGALRDLVLAVPDVALGIGQRSLLVTLARPVTLVPHELRQLTAFTLDAFAAIPPEFAVPSSGPPTS